MYRHNIDWYGMKLSYFQKYIQEHLKFLPVEILYI